MREEQIFEMVVLIICEVIPGLEFHVFKPDDYLVDLGANSVDRAEIIMLALEELSLTTPRIELSEAKSIADLVRILYEKSHSI